MGDIDTAVRNLRDSIGADQVSVDDATCHNLAEDVFFAELPAAAVATPRSIEELRAVVEHTTEHGCAVVARGGGLSYTRGYVPTRPDTILIDTRRLNSVVEINPSDMYATVESGCTWQQLVDAAAEQGLRPPHFGPSSGGVSTLGGSLSQNSLLFGSAQYGTSADSVIGLEVVLADGSLLRTGSGALRNGSPFYRYFGPDLTGLFVGDAGAFGVKARATLRLMPLPAGTSYVSFGFDSFEALLRATCEIGRAGLSSECLAISTYLPPGSPQSDVDPPALHIVLDGHSQMAADEKLAELKSLIGSGTNELDPVLPKMLRGQPFGFIELLDPQGRLQIWTHAATAYSKGEPLYVEIKDFLDSHAAALIEHGIDTTISAALIGGAVLLEPVFYWRDQPRWIHLHGLSGDGETGGADPGPANPAATETVVMIREGLRDLFTRLGVIHFQIGKFYGYAEVLDQNTTTALRGIKAALDPRGLMNPGALGL